MTVDVSLAAALVADRFASHAATRPGDVAFRFVGRHAAEARTVTWGSLHREATAVAAALRGFAARPVVVLCPDPRDFLAALCGCLLARAVAVPVPGVSTRRAAERIRSIVEAAAPAALLAPERTLRQPWMDALLGDGGVARLALEALADSHPAAVPPTEAAAAALMQFTSGSTGAPRGVVLSNRNLAANCAAIVEAYGLSAATRGFSWLPLHHDMGLVGHVLTPLWIGCRSTIMDPLLFLQSPLRWLRRAGEEGATITSAPNFAYQLCAREAEGGADLSGIDLSTITAAVCGGEPVWPETVERFCAAFEPFGFDRDAFSPSYGLAEATLLVSSGRRRGGPRAFSGKVRDPEAAEGTKDVRSVILGRPVSGVAVRIVGSDGGALPEDTIGEIELSGASIGRPATAAPTDSAARVATGDLGFLHDGKLVVTGRRKELIILRGVNVYPADAEAAAVGADPSLNPGGVAAFGVRRTGTEEMMVAFEVQRGPLPPEVFDAMARRVNEAVGRATGHVPAAVIAVPYGALPRTTSGKIRRHALADQCGRGALAVLNATDKRLIVAKETTS